MHTYNHAPRIPPQGEIDPVCGMTVDPQHAAGTQVYAGQRYYFCSTACEQKFLAAPQQYTGTPGPGGSHAAHGYC